MDPTEPLSVRCPACGAALPIDAASPRAIACRYCATSVLVPDAIWQRLHPAHTAQAVHVRGVVHGPAAAPSPPRADEPFAWGSVCDVTVGADGNLYFVTEIGSDGTILAWSCDHRFLTRWKRGGVFPKRGEGKPKIAVTPDGHLLVWRRGKHHAAKLAMRDGADVATLGGPEPAGATAHHLDLVDAYGLAVDVDGSLVALVHDRLVRWSPGGDPLETWPAKRGFFGERHQKLEPLFHEGQPVKPAGAPTIDAVGSRPIHVYSRDGDLQFGGDGALHLGHGDHLVKLARDGTKAWHVALQSSTDYGRIGVDAHGNVYALRHVRKWANGVYRISADGRDVRLLIDGGAPGTPICEEAHLAVFADGTIVVIGVEGSARVFGPDGVARLASPKAREAEAYRAKRVAEEGGE